MVGLNCKQTESEVQHLANVCPDWYSCQLQLGVML